MALFNIEKEISTNAALFVGKGLASKILKQAGLK